MVVVGLNSRRDVSERESVVYDVVGSLDVEGLFDFGVWCYPEVEEDEDCNERREDDIYTALSVNISSKLNKHLPICCILTTECYSTS